MAKRASKSLQDSGGNLAEQKSAKISLQKFFQLHASDTNRYMKAYLIERFRGILKTKDEWSKEIVKQMEGNR